MELLRELLEQRLGRAAPKRYLEQSLAYSRIPLAGAYGVKDDANLLVAGARNLEPISDQPELAMSFGDRAFRAVDASKCGEQS